MIYVIKNFTSKILRKYKKLTPYSIASSNINHVRHLFGDNVQPLLQRVSLDLYNICIPGYTDKKFSLEHAWNLILHFCILIAFSLLYVPRKKKKKRMNVGEESIQNEIWQQTLTQIFMQAHSWLEISRAAKICNEYLTPGKMQLKSWVKELIYSKEIITDLRLLQNIGNYQTHWMNLWRILQLFLLCICYFTSVYNIYLYLTQFNIPISFIIFV